MTGLKHQGNSIRILERKSLSNSRKGFLVPHCGNGNERREKVYLVECERSGPHLEIPYLFLLTDCECGTRNLSTSFFPLRRAQNEAGMEGSTTESVGASTAEIPGVFGRGVVENESLAAFGEVKCAGRSGGSGKGRHGFAARGAARGVVE